MHHSNGGWGMGEGGMGDGGWGINSGKENGSLFPKSQLLQSTYTNQIRYGVPLTDKKCKY